ncbi:hypothetical protein SEA_CECE_264 [Microbacterium phage Cece]|nr:hypothetical protein SEA_CECE_264 [Microbacterium phage Cece]
MTQKKLSKSEKRRLKTIDMREYIQFHLDLYGLGKLVAVVGPERGGRSNDQSWYQLAIKYRPPGNEDKDNIQFYDGRVEVYLGYKNKGGYWNRRNIRIAIEKEARAKRHEIEERRRRAEREAEEARIIKAVWSSAQRSITSGRDDSGTFAL